MAIDRLKQSPLTAPRSVATPSLQRYASNGEPLVLEKSAAPTISPVSLNPSGVIGLPPIVVVARSIMFPCFQRNGWQLGSPSVKHAPGFAEVLEKPMTSPWLLRKRGKPIAPPRVPRSVILSPSHRKGSCVGIPTSGLGVVV